MKTAGSATAESLTEAIALGNALVDAWGSWNPTMTPDAARMAFVSDRGGVPEVWVQDVSGHDASGQDVSGHDAVDEAELPEARRIHLSDDPVITVSWSADSAWLACAVATDGGVRGQVWVVRPDGTDARRIAGGPLQHAELGPWTRSGHRIVVTIPSSDVGEPTSTYLVDPVTGAFEPLAEGELIHVLDLSVGEELVVIRDGRRGHEFCVVVDRVNDHDHPLLPREPSTTTLSAAASAASATLLNGATGATEVALLRPAPDGADAPAELGGPAPLMAYLATEMGAQRHRLVALPLGPNGWRGIPQVLAERDDAELEALDADDAGRLLLMVWNRAGTSEIELFDTTTGVRIGVPELPGFVASSPVLSRDGGTVILSVEGPERPRELWRLDTATHRWTRVTHVPELPARPLVVPTLERYEARDGLALTGWLYRVPAAPDTVAVRASPGEARAVGSVAGTGSTVGGAAMLSLHGGPESQERPTFNPHYQAMLAAGIAVFAPNVRGSSGFGRVFSHLDDLHGRQGAFDDVIA
ncbi:MAG: family peptidase, partial [Subtercola sp.]|nr:family peptidase [Subtercola sp.]